MYSILIAEDDAIILKGLVRNVPWEQEGFTIVGTAADGELALQVLENQPVDIVLSDISMPFMDGLELTRQIKQRFKDTVVILFTGFEKFEYAKEAVHLGAFDFLLKPVECGQLLVCLHAAAKEIDQKRRSVRRERTSLPLLRQHLCIELFLKPMDKKLLDDRMQLIQMPAPAYPLRGAVIALDDYDNAEYMVLTPEQLRFCVANIAGEKLAPLGFAYVWEGEGDLVNCIVQENETQAAYKAFSDIRQTVLLSLGAKISIGLGGCESLNRVSASARQAQRALNAQVLTGRGQVTCWETLEIRPDESIEPDIKDVEARFYELLLRGSEAESIRLLADLRPQIGLELASVTAVRLASVMDRAAATLRAGLLDGVPMLDSDGLVQGLLKQKTLPAQFELLENAVKDLCSQLMERRQKDPVNEQLLAYILAHFHEESLSLPQVARQVHLSPVYLSTYFKQKNGMLFSEYLTKLRLEKACQLLLEGNGKTYEVAMEVGFSNPQYFSVLFKKHFGLSPGAYRIQGKRN